MANLIYLTHICLGGVSNCGSQPIKNDYHLLEGNQDIDVTLCGNSPPILYYTFDGQNKSAKRIEKVDDSQKLYKYKIQLRNLKSNHCGEWIHFQATGFKSYKKSSKIVMDCKYLVDSK